MPKLKIPIREPRINQSFLIGDSTHMLRKIHHELFQFTEPNNETDLFRTGYLALNIAMSCWHMTDWLFNEMTNNDLKAVSEFLNFDVSTKKSLATAITNKCKELEICRVICTAGKHASVADRPNQTIETIFLLESKPDPANDYQTKVVWFINYEGNSYLASEIFQKACRFWENLLMYLGILEDITMQRLNRGW